MMVSVDMLKKHHLGPSEGISSFASPACQMASGEQENPSIIMQDSVVEGVGDSGRELRLTGYAVNLSRAKIYSHSKVMKCQYQLVTSMTMCRDSSGWREKE